MSSRRPTLTINTLPDNVFVEIFSLCQKDEAEQEAGHATESHRSWKWHRLAHVCRTWRHIMFASSRRLSLDLLCTHGTLVEKKLLGYPATFPIVISYRHPYLQGSDKDNLFAALEHRNRVRVVELNVPYSLLGTEEPATVMQEPFPALTHLWLEWGNFATMLPLPDTFLGGSAPCLQTIHMSRIPFPAAPVFLSSASGLVDLDLCNIPPAGYIPPEAMVASLGALPKLKYFTFEFQLGMSHPDRMRPLPITPKVLPALTRFCFKGPFEYFEDLVVQIDAPRLVDLRIEYLEQEVTDFQVPQLCKFFDRSEIFKSSQFSRADLLVQPDTVVIDFRRVQSNQLSLNLSVQKDAIGQVVNQISAMLSDVSHLFIASEFDELGDGIQWLELFQPFTSVKELTVEEELSSSCIPLVLNNITGERAADVLPALELLLLANQPAASVGEFVAARRDMGLFLTVIDDGEEEEFF
ncbi:hypothetical protein EDB89DRAFT_106868 [Lactarius sanguifluus]|nr:hypothetical protein EDB89DRAFT_106868 [Lactarius sanguifluus]